MRYYRITTINVLRARNIIIIIIMRVLMASKKENHKDLLSVHLYYITILAKLYCFGSSQMFFTRKTCK